MAFRRPKKPWALILIFPILVFMLPSPSLAGTPYYYLQVGSFRVREYAIRFGKQMEKYDSRVVVNAKDLGGPAPLYQVFIGPFENWKDIDRKKLELRKQGAFLEDSFIIKKSEKIASLTDTAEVRPKSVETPSVAEPREGVVPGAAILGKEEKKVPTPPAPVEADRKAALSAPVTPSGGEPGIADKPKKEPVPPSPQGLHETSKRQARGRNILKNNLSVSLAHSYTNYQAKIKKRDLEVTSGGTKTITPVSTGGLAGSDFDTSLQLDMLRFRYGFTDFMDAYAEAGAAYKTISSSSFAYGAGIRVNLFEIPHDAGWRSYGAVIGRFVSGKLEDGYLSNGGSQWEKNTDWQDLSVRGELGAVFSRLSVYAGGAYAWYNEKTDRQMISNLPAGTTSYVYRDELEGDPQFGFFTGVDYQFFPQLKANLEGELGYRQRVSLGVAFSF